MERVASTLAVLVLLFVPASPLEAGQESNHVKLSGQQIDELQAAANGAAQCGGYVVIDVDDHEILVGGCDR